MIIATAGHIDHGKTSLVKFLTGVDTDTLPEEKARGISIDLGFAYWRPSSGVLLGFVDVPGHERFVRNMVAGVCGIDYVMLVVAADDGVMPQTVEHLHIVDMLGVSRGVAVVTKIDRVSPGRVREVAGQVRTLLEPTALRSVEIVAVSTLTQEGIGPLRDSLAKAAHSHRAAKAGGRNFRCAVDRVFSVAGRGTVVTGTVFDGAATVGDRVIVAPGGLEVRIRDMQKAGSAARHACAGERCGFNLAGAGRDDVGRGDWLVAAPAHAPTRRMDVRLSLLPTESANLKHWTPLHLHIGTAEVLARVAIGRGASIAPGESAIVRLALESPVVAFNGDHFIVRDQSAQRTLGGGAVLDPFPARRRAGAQARSAVAHILENNEPCAALRALLAECAAGVDLEWFRQVFNLSAERFEALLRHAGPVLIGKGPRWALSPAAADEIADRAMELLGRFHKEHPQSLGVPVAALRAHCAAHLDVAAFTELMRGCAAGGRMELDGEFAALPEHREALRQADETAWQRVTLVLVEAGLKAPALQELAAAVCMEPLALESLLHRKMHGKEVFMVAPGRFYLRSVLARLASMAHEIARSAPQGRFTAAQFRDGVGLSRHLAVNILECLDLLGVTRRVGNVREMRTDLPFAAGAGAHLPQFPAARAESPGSACLPPPRVR